MYDAIDAMTPVGLASQAVAWLLTYTLHSTLFLSLAWLASRRLAQRMPAVEEAVWRFALVAGLITASLQLAAGREPLTGSWSLGTASASTVSAPVDAVQPLPRAIEPRAAIPAAPGSEATAPSTSWRPSLSTLFGGAWLAGALLLSGSWLAAHARLRRRLRPRPQVLEATMVSLLGALRERAGLRKSVRLSCSSRLPVPVALGVRRPEICVPPRALVDLAPEQQEGLLAHELAHLVRRDPFWLAFGRLLASVLFFQPLNWVAVRRLREISELLCDEWAVGRTGRPVSLARCLAEVAGWSIHPVHALPAPGMADRPSHLGKRIRRLLEEARSPQRRVHPAWLAAGMVILVVAVAAAAPGVRAAVAGEAVASVEQPSPSPEPELAAATDEREAPEPPEAESELEPLEPLDELDFADHLEGLSEEEAEKIAARYEEMAERISEQVSKGLEPRMEELGSQIEKQAAAFQDSEEMRQLQRRAQEIAERSRPSEEEMAKLRADIEKLRAEGGLSAEDKRKIREEARRVAQEHRMTAKDRAEIDEIQRQAREMAQRSVREHQAEIDQLRQQIEVETRAMREEIRRQLENDPEIRALRERRHQERDHQREHLREDREQERERRRESTPPPPPRSERHVQLHITPEVRVRVEPGTPVAATVVDVRVATEVAPVAVPTPRPGRPAVAPVAVPTPRPGRPAVAPVAPVAVPTPRPGRPALAPVAPVPTPRARPALAPVAPAAEPTPEPSTPAVAPEPPR